MSKRSRSGSGPRPSGLPRSARLIRNARDLYAAGDILDTRMPCRATYLTDPVLGGMQPAAVDRQGRLAADRSGTVEPVPAVLFEPVQTVLMQNTVSGVMQEARVEAAIAAGFGRVTASPVLAIRPAAGWEVRRVPGGLVLRDATGDVWASGQIILDPAWVSAAVSYRHVAVFLAPKLGVRTPPGMTQAAYTTQRRAAEFRRGRAEGIVAGATVAWRGEPAEETLEWLTFLPGSLGQPFAGVFAPTSVFTAHGGAELFGLSLLGDNDLCMPATVLPTLAARVSRTDVDIIDAGAAEADRHIGGVHYGEGVAAAWRKAARRHGVILLLTGPRMPGTPAASRASNDENLASLWAGLISVELA